MTKTTKQMKQTKTTKTTTKQNDQTREQIRAELIRLASFVRTLEAAYDHNDEVLEDADERLSKRVNFCVENPDDTSDTDRDYIARLQGTSDAFETVAQTLRGLIFEAKQRHVAMMNLFNSK